MGQTPTRPQKPEICSAITLTKMLTILCLCQTMEEGFAYYVNLQSTTGYIPSDDTFGALSTIRSPRQGAAPQNGVE